MAYDQHSNLAYATVAIAPSPATSGTSLTVANGLGSLFPTAPFNCTIFPAGVAPLASNAEIIRVTNVVGDVFTIVRAQEGTTARSIATGWQIANTATKLVFTDIENSIIQFISAGSTKASASEVVFSNSNGVSFGVSGQTVTASINTATMVAMALSAGGSSQNTGTVIFSNSNGVSFGLNAGTLTASINALTTQSVQTQGMVSVNGSTGAIVFSNSNNVTFGGNASTITASASFAQTVQPVAASASNGSFLFSTLKFSNANNVTFGTSAGSVVSASVNPQTVQPVAASASNGSFLFSTLGFVDGNGVTFGTGAGGISASVGTGIAPGSISAGTTTVALGQVVFSNSNNITFGLDGSTVTASFSGIAQSTQPIAASASNGSFSFSTLGFSNANNVTFGTSAGSIISASVAAQSAQPVAASASNGSFLFSTLGFSNANGVTFGTSAGSIISASVAAGAAPGSISAGANSVALGQVVFSNSNNISFGLNGSTVTASFSAADQSTQPVAASASNGSFLFSTLGFSNANGVTFGTSAGSIVTASVAAASVTPLNYFANMPVFQNSVTFNALQSTSLLMPIVLPSPVSFNFIRMFRSGVIVGASTTAATTGNTQFSCGYTRSHNFVFYSLGTGASSKSIISHFSTQVLENYSHNVSAAANSTQFSYSQRYSMPCSTGTTGFTHDYSSSAASLNFNSASATMLTALKQMDFNVATSLSAGNWWLVYGQSSTSSSQFTSVGFRNIVTFNIFGASLATIRAGVLGSSVLDSVGFGFFNGNITLGGAAGTTSIYPMSSLTTNQSAAVPYLQFYA